MLYRLKKHTNVIQELREIDIIDILERTDWFYMSLSDEMTLFIMSPVYNMMLFLLYDVNIQLDESSKWISIGQLITKFISCGIIVFLWYEFWDQLSDSYTC